MLVRTDRTVNFNWDKVVPVQGLQRNDFSVRWTGSLVTPAPGDYRLGTRVNYCYACESNEGFRLYVDNKLVVDGTQNGATDASLHFSDTKPCWTVPEP